MSPKPLPASRVCTDQHCNTSNLSGYPEPHLSDCLFAISYRSTIQPGYSSTCATQALASMKRRFALSTIVTHQSFLDTLNRSCRAAPNPFQRHAVATLSRSCRTPAISADPKHFPATSGRFALTNIGKIQIFLAALNGSWRTAKSCTFLGEKRSLGAHLFWVSHKLQNNSLVRRPMHWAWRLLALATRLRFDSLLCVI